MFKLSNKWVFFSVFLWLLSCQGLFILVQSSLGQGVVDSIQAQLRQELDSSNYNFLARSLTDYTTSGAIRCTVLDKASPEKIQILDLRYMEENCRISSVFLKGVSFSVKLKSMNGDSYQLQFISNNSSFFYLALWGFRILGIILVLAVVFVISYKAQKDIMAYQLELDFANKVKDISMQVSHDIRSPLATLRVAIDDIYIEDIQYKKIIKSALGRIDEIAMNLLKEKIHENKILLIEEDLIPLIESIVAEKIFEFKENKNILIELKSLELPGEIFVNINQVEFKRMFSNLINNAVEAIPLQSKGSVLIEIDLTNIKTILIKISDNGKGIPPHLLTRLGERGLSFGKEGNQQSGSGLGLNHSKAMIQHFSGKFNIISTLGEGTTVEISLPLAERVKEVFDYYDFLLIDNDELVRITWQAKAKRKNIKLITLNSYVEFNEIENKINKEGTEIYIDYELGQGEVKGVELAELLYQKGYKNLTIATGHSEEKFKNLTWLKHTGKSPPF